MAAASRPGEEKAEKNLMQNTCVQRQRQPSESTLSGLEFHDTFEWFEESSRKIERGGLLIGWLETQLFLVHVYSDNKGILF